MAEITPKKLEKLRIENNDFDLTIWGYLGMSKEYFLTLLSRDEYCPVADKQPTEKDVYYTDPASGNPARFHAGQCVIYPDKNIADGWGLSIAKKVETDSEGVPTKIFWEHIKPGGDINTTTPFIVVDHLPDAPESGNENKLHLVPTSVSAFDSNGEDFVNNKFDEYLYVNGKWEEIGKVQLDINLDDYVKNTDVVDYNKDGLMPKNLFALIAQTLAGGEGLVSSLTTKIKNNDAVIEYYIGDGKGGQTKTAVIPVATQSSNGVVKLGSDETQTRAANAVTNTASRTYAIQRNNSGQLVVNVPWEDSNRTTAISTPALVGLGQFTFDYSGECLANTGFDDITKVPGNTPLSTWMESVAKGFNKIKCHYLARDSNAQFVADKLSTSRTLWGRSFDGSGNVTGAIANTGSITPSSGNSSDIGSTTLPYRYILSRFLTAYQHTVSLGDWNAGTSYADRESTAQHLFKVGTVASSINHTMKPNEKQTGGLNINFPGESKGISITTYGIGMVSGNVVPYAQIAVGDGFAANAPYVNFHTRVAMGVYGTFPTGFNDYYFYCGGAIRCTSLTGSVSSDIRLKENIDGSVDYLKRLKDLGNVVEYNYTKEAIENHEGLDDKRHTGLIYQNAQNSEIPNIAAQDDDGHGFINYYSPDLIATLIGAVQQLSARVEELENKLKNV